MLKINDIDYNDVEVIIDFDPFEGTVDGKKRKGNALYITCKTKDFKLGIETVYDINWIKELKIDDKKDISKYIVGLPYEDKNDWMDLTDKCNCFICKMSNNSCNLSLNGHFEECEEEFNIEFTYNFDI